MTKNDLLPQIHDLLRESKKTLVILDDDPTGCQTVFDVPILTDLDAQSIRDAIDEAPPVLFILTNSRALTAAQTTELHQRLGGILQEFGDDLILISRSDSNLHGHFPLETDTLRDALGIPQAPTLFIPDPEAEISLSDTEIPHLHNLSPHDLRSGDIREKIAALPDSSTCIINATSLKDLDLLSLVIHQSERRFIIRSASTFVQSLAGIVSRDPLEPWQMQDLDPNPNGGLIIIGSHSEKTSAQLTHLLENAPDAVPLELNLPALLENPDDILYPLSAKLNQVIESGKTAVLFTSREATDDPVKTISRALVSLAQSVAARPSFLIVKGSSTASDIAIDALGIKQAMILGQILPGVPVWTLGNETRHPGLAYIIFPGNTGPENALTQAYQKLK